MSARPAKLPVGTAEVYGCSWKQQTFSTPATIEGWDSEADNTTLQRRSENGSRSGLGRSRPERAILI